MKLSERMSRLGTETAFDVLVRAKQLQAEGRSIIHLEIGEPDFDTPENIVDSAIQALKNGAHHYGPSAGLPELRKAIAEDVSKRRGVTVKPSEVVVTPGAKPVIFFAALAMLDPGDEAIYPNPGFPIYESMINYVGAKAVPVPLREDRNWSLDIDELAHSLTPKTKLVILNSPHNPTGGVIPAEDLHRIAELALRYDFMILSDEIYSRVLYSGDYHSIFSLPGMKERTILLDGFSKIYAMTGWRLGYGIMREDLAVHVCKLQTNATSCTATFSQLAGVEALTGDQSKPEEMVEEFRKRRDLMVKGLNEIPGMSCKTPDGAFYVFPNVRKLGLPSKKLADLLLEEAGVACLSGTAFGAWGEGYIRFSYANSQENLREALKRVKALVVNSKLVPM
jgi:aspartate/methionine/tyrosine aminotransferase